MRKFHLTRPQVFIDAFRSFSGRAGALCLFVIAISFCLGYMAREIRIVEIEDSAVPSPYLVYTYDEDPVQVLMREKDTLDIASVDTVSVSYVHANLAKIDIARGFDVYVTADGKTRNILMTHGDTANVALNRSGVKLGEDDEINCALFAPAKAGMEIVVDRVRYETTLEEESIPFETVKNETDELPKGTTVQKQEGSEGIRQKTTLHKYINGELVSSEVMGELMMKEPVNAVYEIGTAETAAPVMASSGEINASGYLVCESTAYTYMTSDFSDVTASGRPAGYGNVAVDPSVIPLGTQLYITSLDGSYVYGYALAADTGGAIQGNMVDLFFNTYSECINWGRRAIRVYIVG